MSVHPHSTIIALLSCYTFKPYMGQLLTCIAIVSLYKRAFFPIMSALVELDHSEALNVWLAVFSLSLGPVGFT